MRLGRAEGCCVAPAVRGLGSAFGVARWPTLSMQSSRVFRCMEWQTGKHEVEGSSRGGGGAERVEKRLSLPCSLPHGLRHA
jgi:hypothetical protein